MDSLISFDDIPFSVEAVTMLKTLGLRDDFFEEIHEMADRTNALGRPRAVVRRSLPKTRDENQLALRGERIESAWWHRCTKSAEQVFCFVVTSAELDALVKTCPIPLRNLEAGADYQPALRQAANGCAGRFGKGSKRPLCAR